MIISTLYFNLPCVDKYFASVFYSLLSIFLYSDDPKESQLPVHNAFQIASPLVSDLFLNSIPVTNPFSAEDSTISSPS